MLLEIKDAFLFLLDIYKGNLLSQDLYLLGLIMLILPLAESIQEIRKKSIRKNKWGIIYLKWIPISFLASSIYLSGFYFITEIINNFNSIPEAFLNKQSLHSTAIISLMMVSITSLIVAIWKLKDFFILKKVLITVILNSAIIAAGMYLINIAWYEKIQLPIWCYALIGLINTVFLSILLIEEKEQNQNSAA